MNSVHRGSKRCKLCHERKRGHSCIERYLTNIQDTDEIIEVLSEGVDDMLRKERAMSCDVDLHSLIARLVECLPETFYTEGGLRNCATENVLSG